MNEKKRRRRNKKYKRIAVFLLMVLFACGISAGILYERSRPVDRSGDYAGSYARGSARYKEYLEFVKKNALSREVVDGKDTSYTKNDDGMVVYTLDNTAVKEWGEAGNIVHFQYTEELVLDCLKENGYTVTLQAEENKNQVQVQNCGVIKTSFFHRKIYDVEEDIQVIIAIDQISEEVYSVVVAHTEKEDSHTEQAAALLYIHMSEVLDSSADAVQEIAQEIHENEQIARSGDTDKVATYYNRIAQLNCLKYRDYPGWAQVITPSRFTYFKNICW